jgi:hypothetical protein
MPRPRAALFALLSSAAAVAACGLGLEGTATEPPADDGSAPLGDGARPPADADGAEDSAADVVVDGPAPDASDAGSDAPTGAITFVQAVEVPWVSSSTISATLTVTAGNLLVVAAYWSSTSPVTVADTLGNTWTSTTQSPGTSCPGSGVAQIWYAMNANGGADTVTVTAPAGSGPGLTVLEYAGVATSNALEWQANKATSSASSAMDTPDVTTFSPVDVVVAIFQDVNGLGSMTPGTGYTARARDTNFYAMVEDDLPGVGPGNHAVTATLPAGKNDGCWTGAAVAFKAR